MDKLDRLRFWVQKTLPLVYDDSLTYYELLNKAVDKINEIVSVVNEMSPAIEAAVAAKIDALIEAGEFDDIIAKALETALANKQLSGDIVSLHVIPHYAIQSLTTAENGDIIVTGSREDAYTGGESVIMAIDPANGRILDYKEFSGGHAGQIGYYNGYVFTSDYASAGGAGAKWWCIPYDEANRAFGVSGWYNLYVTIPSGNTCNYIAIDAEAGKFYAFDGIHTTMNSVNLAYVADMPAAIGADVYFNAASFDPAPITIVNPQAVSGNQSGQGWLVKGGNFYRMFNAGAVAVWSRNNYIAEFVGFYNCDKLSGGYIACGEFEKFHISKNAVCYTASQFYLPDDGRLNEDPCYAVGRDADGNPIYDLSNKHVSRYFVITKYDLQKNVPASDRAAYVGKTLTLNVKQYADDNTERTFLTESGQCLGYGDYPLYDIRLAMQIAISNAEQVVTINIIGNLECESLEFNETAQNVIVRAAVPQTGNETIHFGHVEIVGKGQIYGRSAKIDIGGVKTRVYCIPNIEYLQVTGRGIFRGRLLSFEDTNILDTAFPGGYFAQTYPYIHNEAILMLNACSTSSNDNIIDVYSGSLSSVDFGRGTGVPGLTSVDEDEYNSENYTSARAIFGGYGFKQPGIDNANSTPYTSNGWKDISDINGNIMKFYPGKYSITFGVPAGATSDRANVLIDISKGNRRGCASVVYTVEGAYYMDVIQFALGADSGANMSKIYITSAQTLDFSSGTYVQFGDVMCCVLRVERVLD